MFENVVRKYFTNDDGMFEPNEHVDKFALVYLFIIFILCITLKALGVI